MCRCVREDRRWGVWRGVMSHFDKPFLMGVGLWCAGASRVHGGRDESTAGWGERHSPMWS